MIMLSQIRQPTGRMAVVTSDSLDSYEVKILLLAIYQLQALFESSNAMDSTRLQGCYHRRIPA